MKLSKLEDIALVEIYEYIERKDHNALSKLSSTFYQKRRDIFSLFKYVRPHMRDTDLHRQVNKYALNKLTDDTTKLDEKIAIVKTMVNDPTLSYISKNPNIFEDMVGRKLNLNSQIALGVYFIAMGGDELHYGDSDRPENNLFSKESLSIYGDRIGIAGAKAIAEALEKNSTLQKLEIVYSTPTPYFSGGVNIGNDGVRALAEALKKNSALEKLCIRQNQIGDDGAEAVADALATNTTLKVLDFSFNAIGDAGAKAIADALNENHTLQSINFFRNAIGDAGKKALADAVADRKIKGINVTINDEEQSLWRAQRHTMFKPSRVEMRSLSRLRDLREEYEEDDCIICAVM